MRLAEIPAHFLQMESSRSEFGDEASKVFATNDEVRDEVEDRGSQAREHEPPKVDVGSHQKQRRTCDRHRAEEDDSLDERANASAKSKGEGIEGECANRLSERLGEEFPRCARRDCGG